MDLNGIVNTVLYWEVCNVVPKVLSFVSVPRASAGLAFCISGHLNQVPTKTHYHVKWAIFYCKCIWSHSSILSWRFTIVNWDPYYCHVYAAYSLCSSVPGFQHLCKLSIIVSLHYAINIFADFCNCFKSEVPFYKKALKQQFFGNTSKLMWILFFFKKQVIVLVCLCRISKCLYCLFLQTGLC